MLVGEDPKCSVNLTIQFKYICSALCLQISGVMAPQADAVLACDPSYVIPWVSRRKQNGR